MDRIDNINPSEALQSLIPSEPLENLQPTEPLANLEPTEPIRNLHVVDPPRPVLSGQSKEVGSRQAGSGQAGSGQAGCGHLRSVEPTEPVWHLGITEQKPANRFPTEGVVHCLPCPGGLRDIRSNHDPSVAMSTQSLSDINPSQSSSEIHPTEKLAQIRPSEELLTPREQLKELPLSPSASHSCPEEDRIVKSNI